jgi:FdhD protein
MGAEGKTREISVDEVRGEASQTVADRLAVEEPMEIRVRSVRPDGSTHEQAISVTMRTPGDDAELAVGFLYTEGLLRSREDVTAVETPAENIVVVALAPGITIAPKTMERNFFMTSACGVCGKTSIDAVRVTPAAPLGKGPVVSVAVIHSLPTVLRGSQPTFEATGGLHAAALFDRLGHMTLLREDIGRHNAVDKVVGALLMTGQLPPSDSILMVSGRAGFELVQKAVVAAIPIFAAVGAPSSLSAALAAEAGMTLLGFVREGRFNVYSGRERLSFGSPS